MKKIIHMSDLHHGAGNKLRRGVDELFSELIAEYGSLAEEYIIVITGDLVERATPDDFSLYAEINQQLDRLKDCGFDLVVVPGNHDLGTGSMGEPNMVRLFEETFYGTSEGFPKLFCRGGIAFVVLNSLADELHDDDRRFAQGEIGGVQLDYMVGLLLSEKARKCERRVVCLHHHPFDWLPLHRLIDSKALHHALVERVMNVENGVSVDALLYGHNHRGGIGDCDWNIPRAYDAGTATLKHSTTALKPKCSIRMIDLNNPDPSRDKKVLKTSLE